MLVLLYGRTISTNETLWKKSRWKLHKDAAWWRVNSWMGVLKLWRGRWSNYSNKVTLVLVERPEKQGDLNKRPPVAATRRTCHVHIQNSLRKGQFSSGHRFPLCLLPVLLDATLNFLPLLNSVTFISHSFFPS